MNEGLTIRLREKIVSACLMSRDSINSRFDLLNHINQLTGFSEKEVAEIFQWSPNSFPSYRVGYVVEDLLSHK